METEILLAIAAWSLCSIGILGFVSLFIWNDGKTWQKHLRTLSWAAFGAFLLIMAPAIDGRGEANLAATTSMLCFCAAICRLIPRGSKEAESHHY